MIEPGRGPILIGENYRLVQIFKGMEKPGLELNVFNPGVAERASLMRGTASESAACVEKASFKVVVHTFNPSTWEAEAGGSL